MRGRVLVVGLVVLAACGGVDEAAPPGTGPATSPPPGPSTSPPTGPGTSPPTGPGTSPPTGPVDPDVLAAMLLHLPDAPAGATVGDDSTCEGGGLSTEGGSDAFLDLVAERPDEIDGCFIQLEAPDVFVDSLVVSFPDDETSARAIAPEAFAGIVRYYGLDCCGGEPVGALAVVDGPGDGPALGAVSASDSSAVVGWRVGRFVGAVSVHRFDGASGALAEAQRYAARQDGRMRAPATLPVGIDDDRLVALEQASFPTWWVGEVFAPPGFPPTELSMSHAGEAMVDLDYQPPLRIEVFDTASVPAGSETDQMLGVTDELFDSPCTVREPIDSPAGEAFLLGRHIPDEFFADAVTSSPEGADRVGWGELVGGDCPVGAPNLWMVTVDTADGQLIRINGALCYRCLLPPDPDLAYRTPEGLRVVAAGLEPFRP